MRTPIEAPRLFPHAHNILTAANVIEGARWDDGVEFTPEGCNVIFAHEAGCFQYRGMKEFQGCDGTVEFYPYTLELTILWSTIDLMADPKSRTLRALEVGTPAVLERLMEHGVAMDDPNMTLGVDAPSESGISVGGIIGRQARTALGGLDETRATPTLTNLTTNVTSTSLADGPLGVLGQIEKFFVDASSHVGSAGTIMMPPDVAVQCRDGLIFDADGTVYTVATGSRVVIGNFTKMWGVLGTVDVWLGDTNVVEEYERASNEYIIQVERAALVMWNPCLVVTSLDTEFSTGDGQAGSGWENPATPPAAANCNFSPSGSWIYDLNGTPNTGGQIVDTPATATTGTITVSMAPTTGDPMDQLEFEAALNCQAGMLVNLYGDGFNAYYVVGTINSSMGTTTITYTNKVGDTPPDLAETGLSVLEPPIPPA